MVERESSESWEEEGISSALLLPSGGKILAAAGCRVVEVVVVARNRQRVLLVAFNLLIGWNIQSDLYPVRNNSKLFSYIQETQLRTMVMQVTGRPQGVQRDQDDKRQALEDQIKRVYKRQCTFFEILHARHY